MALNIWLYVSRTAHKGLLLHFFIISGSFPDEHEFRMGIARGKDHGVPQGVEFPRRFPVLRQITEVLQLVFHSSLPGG